MTPTLIGNTSISIGQTNIAPNKASDYLEPYQQWKHIMITGHQVETAKTLWEQSRESALIAHETWALVMQSLKSLQEGYRAAGIPLTEATENLERLMEDHSERHTKALEHMDKMNQAYGEILEQFKNPSA